MLIWTLNTGSMLGNSYPSRSFVALEHHSNILQGRRLKPLFPANSVLNLWGGGALPPVVGPVTWLLYCSIFGTVITVIDDIRVNQESRLLISQKRMDNPEGLMTITANTVSSLSSSSLVRLLNYAPQAGKQAMGDWIFLTNTFRSLNWRPERENKIFLLCSNTLPLRDWFSPLYFRHLLYLRTRKRKR